ncbi:hypothetical protein HWD99_08085 [Microbacterium sp. C5A9]|uniref:hypothetical protein n=1 Tax=Microbacterium sp. C5A9 TaxID=2736663 RepID=UPI001F52A090|nr:hypothetical protein [Microbacterium sp. C5A9]MCI1018577.1 hypothetical protein [Microbacterium sp. C5A9]
MSYVDVLREQIIIQLDEAEIRVRDAIRVAPGLIRRAVEAAANHYLGTVAVLIPDAAIDWLADQITSAALAALQDCLVRIAVLREAAAYLGSPDELRAVAEKLGDIGGSATAMDINKDALDGLMSWDDGEPTRRYEVAVENQIDDLAKVAPAMSSLKDVLRTHADDIETYYLELLALVTGAVAAILGVVAAILSLIAGALTFETGVGPVIGIIAAALSLVTAMLGVVVSGIAAVQLFVSSTQGTSNKLDALQIDMLEWRKPSFAQIE